MTTLGDGTRAHPETPRVLLIVHHTPSPPTRELLESVIAGASHPDIGGVHVRVVPALAATVPDVLSASAFLFGTPANFGYMSGALKHFFDTAFYPCLGALADKPYAAWVHGNDDTSGAAASVDKISTAWGLRRAAVTASLTGSPSSADRAVCFDSAATVAAIIGT